MAKDSSKAAASEKVRALGLKLKANLDKVLIGVLGLILAGIGFLVMDEKGTLPASPEPPKKIVLEPKIDTQSPLYFTVTTMATWMEPFEDSPYAKIGGINMFNVKEVRDAKKQNEAISEILNEARRLLAEGDFAGAKRRVDGVLEGYPGNEATLRLKAEIEERAAEAAEKTAEVQEVETGGGGV